MIHHAPETADPCRWYTPPSVKAIAKARPGPGVEIVEVPDRAPGPGEVRLKLEAASVCGTDLHIWKWDAWSAARIKPPRIIGHEFCGTVVELGEGVEGLAVGDFVATESHAVCGVCPQCRAGQAHVCENTRILGVDIDGGFAPYATIPAGCAMPTDRRVPPHLAAFQDALGNAVHTVADGPVAGRNLLITGMGPIGLFAATVAKAMGAARVVATEVSPYRIELARRIGVETIVNPLEEDAAAALRREFPDGVDGTLEMSGNPASLALAVEATRPGGRISLLGVYGEDREAIDMNAVIFKGLRMQGIVGRRLPETWNLMRGLFAAGNLDLEPVVTHRMHYLEFEQAMRLMAAGKAGKVVFGFD